MSNNKQMRKKRSEEQQGLIASEEKYRTIFDSIDEGFVIAELLFDEAGRSFDLLVLETNASFDRLLRTTNAVGKRALEIFPDAEASWFEAFGRVVETGQSMRFENYLAALDKWFDLYISRIGGEGSRRFAIVFNDITERKNAERELKRTNQLLQATLDSSLEHIQLLKAVRDETGKIIDFIWLFTNKKWNDQWGEMAGKRLLQENPGVVETGLFEKFISVTESGVPMLHEQYYAHEQFNGWFLQSLVKVGDGFLTTTLDITQRKLAEEALRQSEEKYRTLFDSIDEGFCIVEVLFDEHEKPLDYRFLETNASFEHQTGIVNGAGRRMREIEPHHEAYWFEIYGQVALTGEPARFERYAAYLGHRWYDVYAFRLGEPHERKVGILFNDITERQLSEKRQSFLLKLSDALRPLSDPLAIQETASRLLGEELAADRIMYVEVVNTDGAMEYVVERNYLASPDTIPVIGRFAAAQFGPSLIQEGRSGRTMIVDDIENEIRLAPSDQAAFLGIGIQAYITTPLIKDGQWVASVAVHQVEPRVWTPSEVTLVEEVAERTWAAVERAKAEDQLRRSEENLRLIVESAKGYAIFTTDPDGFINSWNAGAARIFGWGEAEILGQNAEVLFTPEDRAAGEPQKELATAQAQGIAPDIRWHQHKNGSRVFIDGEVRPLRDEQRNGFVKIGRDLTAQRQAEEALRTNQKKLQLLNETLEQKVQEKTAEVRELASDLIKATQQERHRISHLLHDDLQQSIYAIQMQMTFLSNMLTDDDEAARKEALDITDQLNEILEMTRQLSIDLSPPILRGEGLWHAINWLVVRMQQRYELPIELQAEGDFVIANAELHVLLFNCIRELLFNIVKHAEASQAVVVLQWTNDKRLRIEVRDNGKGFSPDQPKHLLMENQTPSESLGLASIRHQLNLFHGSMEIRSEPGAGTQVILNVPISGDR